MFTRRSVAIATALAALALGALVPVALAQSSDDDTAEHTTEPAEGTTSDGAAAEGESPVPEDAFEESTGPEDAAEESTGPEDADEEDAWSGYAHDVRADHRDALAEALAEELGLGADTVTDALEAAYAELAEDWTADRRARIEDALSAAVEDGALTQEQADAVLAAAEAGIVHGIGGCGGYGSGHGDGYGYGYGYGRGFGRPGGPRGGVGPWHGPANE